MTDPDFAETLGRLGRDGFVSADDVLTMRREVFRDGVVSRAELDAVFALVKRAPEGDPEWPAFFEETVCDFYLREEEPQGYLTADEFADLKTRVLAGDGASATELRALVKILEAAQKTTPGMSAFVGAEIRKAVLAKPGAPHVTAEEARLIERYVFAPGGAGNVGVTRAEAEFLFDLNDAVAGGGSDPLWAEVFRKGVVNHLMAHLGARPLAREEAQRLHEFASDHSANVGGFFRRMLTGFGRRAGETESRAEREARRDREAEEAAALTVCEADWVADRLGRDGRLDEAERALVARLRELSGELPAKLREAVERAA